MTRRSVTVSTSLETRGGISSYVRMLAATPLWTRWGMRHVATHRDGSAAVKVATFAAAVPLFAAQLLRRPSVVHVHMSSYGSFVRKALVVWASWVARVPVLIHVHGSEFEVFHDRLPPALRTVVRLTLERAGVVVALGERWARRLEAMAPRARVVAIPNGVAVPPARTAASGAVPTVVFLGEIGERKGAFTLLDAWARLAAEPGFDAALMLAGDREVERARAAVAAAGTASSVTIRSWLSPGEVQGVLAGADVFVLPSRSEGQPMALLEAMAAGLAVVVSDVGGIPEMVDDGHSGLVVAPDDVDGLAAALRRVLGDEDLRRKLGAAARERVLERFDIDVVWRRFDALYEEISR